MDSVAQRASATNTVLAYQSRIVSSPIEIPVTLKVQNKAILVTAHIIDTRTLIDSGAYGPLISLRFVKEQGLPLVRKARPLTLRTIDDSPVKGGKVTHEVHIRMEVGQHHEVITLDVADIGHDNIILGISWLRQHNPRIDWARSTLVFDSDYGKTWCSPPSPVSTPTREKDPPPEKGEAAWRRKAIQQAPPGHFAHLKAIRTAQTPWYRSARVAALQEAAPVLHKLWQERISFSGATFA